MDQPYELPDVIVFVFVADSHVHVVSEESAKTIEADIDSGEEWVRFADLAGEAYRTRSVMVRQLVRSTRDQRREDAKISKALKTEFGPEYEDD